MGSVRQRAKTNSDGSYKSQRGAVVDRTHVREKAKTKGKIASNHKFNDPFSIGKKA